MRRLVLLAFATCALVVAAPSGAKLGPPVIKENFSPLPCPANPSTTLELQGCAQKEILRTNALINAKSATIFGLLRSTSAKTRFVKGAKAWFAYRRADCLSASDVYEGGSLSAVEYGGCVVSRNKQRLKDLSAFEKRLKTS